MGEPGWVVRAWLPKAIRESASIEELLEFLNHVPLPNPDQVVGLWHHTSVVEQGGRYLILAGDQIQYVAETEGEVHAHLAGCALATSFVLHLYSEGQIDLTR